MNTTDKYRYNVRNALKILISGIIGITIASCSTGIESTKKIRMTKEDVRMMEKTPEQKFAESIHGTPLASWEKGKRFMAMSDRTPFIFEPTGLLTDDALMPTSGKMLYYAGLDSHMNPDLREECVILFSDGQSLFRYRTGKTSEAALTEIDSSKLPLIADLDLIDQWRERISGMTLWTKSNLWYDASGNRLPGLKFAKVSITNVTAAEGDFPINIHISGPNGEDGFLHMNYTSDIHDSRDFSSIFFLSDPKSKYPQIADEHWTLIQRGKVDQGMTKEECKLSLGNPDEVGSGHNRSQTIDIWQYSDGTYLFFTDGLLSNFRQ